MRIAVYPGSFDPVTNGHIDIIKRASTMVDKLIIGVLHNSAKTPLFSAKERVNMLSEVCQGLTNVEIRAFEGLLVDFVVECNATIVVRGLRAVTDFEYELQWAQSNRIVCPHMDTMFLVTNVQYSYLSSSVVREYAAHRGDISAFVPECVAQRLKEKYS
ncbi:MAG: pantetheine-phosphate adenylyltransferase [Clostridiales bacterium]|nr:pantetheine-phosphate adenylyltransferase [Clostridiales bacterium]